MTYNFWKKAGVVAGVVGALLIASSVFAKDSSVDFVNEVQNQHGSKRGMMQRKTSQSSEQLCLFMHNKEECEAINLAISSGDYQAWLDLVSQDGELPEFLKNITAENFARFSEMYQYMENARLIREELGIEYPRKNRYGKMDQEMRVGCGVSRFKAQAINIQ